MTDQLPRNDEGAIVLNAVEAKALALLLVHRHLRDDGNWLDWGSDAPEVTEWSWALIEAAVEEVVGDVGVMRTSFERMTGVDAAAIEVQVNP